MIFVFLALLAVLFALSAMAYNPQKAPALGALFVALLLTFSFLMSGVSPFSLPKRQENIVLAEEKETSVSETTVKSEEDSEKESVKEEIAETEQEKVKETTKEDPEEEQKEKERIRGIKQKIYSDVKVLFDELLKKDGEKVSPLDRLQQVEDGKIKLMDTVDEKVFRRIHFTDQMDSENGRSQGIQGLLAMAHFYFSDPQDDTKNMLYNYSQYISLDEEHGIAYVPLDLFSPTLVGYTSIAVLNKDGMWQLDPLTIVQQMRLVDAATATRQLENSKPSDSKEKEPEATIENPKAEEQAETAQVESIETEKNK